MTDILAKVTGVTQKTWNTIKAVGPFLIAQSDRLSETYQRHLGRVAEVDALRELLKSEVETRSKIRQKLLDRYVDAPLEDRPRIEQDIQYLDGVTRSLRIASKSLNYSSPEGVTESPKSEPTPIEGHWLDRFNDLARQQNEEWREELLARALGRETAAPGSVSPRALWLIGSVERSIFEAFSKLLDMCIWTYPNSTPFLPNSGSHSSARKVHGEERLTIGHLLFRLGDIGLVADHLTSSRSLDPEFMSVVYYDEDARIIKPKQQIKIQGVLLTPLGDSIASFYKPEWNSTGKQIFEEWLATLTPDKAELQIAKISDE